MGLCRGAVLPTTVGCLLLFEFMKKEAFQRYLLNDHLIPGASRSLARVPFPQEGLRIHPPSPFTKHAFPSSAAVSFSPGPGSWWPQSYKVMNVKDW